ncbi:MAG TPA: tetratricopeptide repeat protein [Candidatus Acidoferrales bacterium]|jgi:tetratricopeptide (TPR) repeat protein|nr:tetratricopeptide repeat protein [Candidatus Acidoferrales bacterium]
MRTIDTVLALVMASMTALVTLTAAPLAGPYIGSDVCRACHAAKFESQSKTGHARALAAARPGIPIAGIPAPESTAQWAFGAGEKAITWVSQTGPETIAEHGLSYYAATKSLDRTPGHANSNDVVYRTFDSVGTALRCFRCHSTGPVTLKTGYQVQPSEPGVRCEACHGPGRAHASSAGSPGTIQNPKRLTPAELNVLCGACHRQASDLDDDTDWSNAWNVRHQPGYLHRAACFRNSNGKVSCLTCHDPHEPLKKTAASYDARCAACHAKVRHTMAIAARSCVSCHMPQVSTSPALHFTNHWIGIYNPQGRKLVPSKRMVKALQPASVVDKSAAPFLVPSDPSTLVPVYEEALSQRESESGPDDSKVARAAANLGLFLVQIGNNSAAEAPLRRALAVDRQNSDPASDADRENLAVALQGEGKRDEALALFRDATSGSDAKVAARSFARLAQLDPGHADSYYRSAIAAEEQASGSADRRVAVLLHEYALTLRARNDDAAAEPALRRALAIQEKAAKPDYRLTAGILNTLGNLLEGRHQFDEAEKLERTALRLSEEKFGPESAELAMTCTNLADVLWNKRELQAAGQLYRRAAAIDASLYGAEQPETAADIANLGMLMKDAGQTAAADSLLRQALAIYEKTLGPDSAQAKFVRENLAVRPR